MKAFEQCCDEVAVKFGFNPKIDRYYIVRLLGQDELFDFFEEATQLYREESIREAIKLARTYEGTKKTYTYGREKYTEQQIIDKLKPKVN